MRVFSIGLNKPKKYKTKKQIKAAIIRAKKEKEYPIPKGNWLKSNNYIWAPKRSETVTWIVPKSSK